MGPRNRPVRKLRNLAVSVPVAVMRDPRPSPPSAEAAAREPSSRVRKVVAWLVRQHDPRGCRNCNADYSFLSVSLSNVIVWVGVAASVHN